MSLIHSFTYSISFDDVDAAGIVYFPRYFHLCHLAFEDLFNVRGPSRYPDLILKDRVGFPTVHIDADFKRPLHYGDRICVELAITEIKTSSMITSYRFVNNPDEETNFMATITTVYTDLVTKKAVALPSDLRRFLSGETS